MSRPERLRWFLSEARANHHPNARHLVRHFGVSDATAKRDVDRLKHTYQAPLLYRPSQRGYALADVDWQLPTPSTPVDGAIAIATARQLLHAVHPGLADRLSVSLQQDDALGEVHRLDRVLEVTSSRAGRYDGPHMPALLAACARRQRVRIAFASPWRDDPPSWRTVDPWVMQLHDDHFYLRGFCHRARAARCFSLAGIKAIASVDGPARAEPRGFRGEVLRGLGVGQGPVQEATVVLHGAWARYASMECWHPNQVDAWVKNSQDRPVLRRQFPYALETEVVRRLLSCGGDIEVRSPLSLRQALAAAFRAGAERNGPDGREVGGRDAGGRAASSVNTGTTGHGTTGHGTTGHGEDT